MMFSDVIITSTFLANILPKLLTSDRYDRVVFLYNNDTQDTIDVMLNIVANQINGPTWFIRNVDAPLLSFKNHSIPYQGIFLIVAIPKLANSSQWIVNLNRTILFHPRCNALILSDDKPKMDSETVNALHALWNISIVNAGIVFFGKINEIFVYNPFTEEKLFKIYSSDNLSNQVPVDLFDRVFPQKLTNLNGAIFPLMVGLDFGRVYLKRNPNKLKNYTNLGGSEVYATEIFGKWINASVIYNLQITPDNGSDISEYLKEITLPINLSYDASEPITIVPKTHSTPEFKYYAIIYMLTRLTFSNVAQKFCLFLIS